MCAILIVLPFLIVGAWFFAKFLIITMIVLVIGAAVSGLLDGMFNQEPKGGDSDDDAGS